MKFNKNGKVVNKKISFSLEKSLKGSSSDNCKLFLPNYNSCNFNNLYLLEPFTNIEIYFSKTINGYGVIESISKFISHIQVGAMEYIHSV